MTAPIKDRKIRVGLVGCGRISKNHFQSIEAHSADIDLVGVCDENSNVLKNLPLDASIKRFKRLSELLVEKPDLAIITTPVVFILVNASKQPERGACHD